MSRWFACLLALKGAGSLFRLAAVRWSYLWLMALLVACGEGPVATEVLVVIDAQPALAKMLTRLEIQILDGRAADAPRRQLNVKLGNGADAHPLPVSFSVAARQQSDTGEFRVLVTGYDSTSTPLAEQQVITRFVPDRAGRLDIYLYAGCMDLCRSNGQAGALTCNQFGNCEEVPVRTDLPPATPGDLGGYTVVSTGAGLDGGMTAPALDAQTSDADLPVFSDGGLPVFPEDASPLSDGASQSDARPEADANLNLGSDASVDATVDAGVDANVAPNRDAGVDASAPDAGSFSANPLIPAPSMTCPAFVSGAMTIMGLSVQVYAGTPGATKGPLLLYWHATNGMGTEAMSMMPAAVRTEILEAGGMIVAPNMSTGTGATTSTFGVWFLGDLAFADLITACAVRDANIDPRRIYATGANAGGILAGVMAFQRATYLAAVTTNSGGLADTNQAVLQAGATRAPPVMTMHGGASDNVVYNFGTLSMNLASGIKARGALAINCEHTSGHAGASAALKQAAWQFMKDHPFGVTPEPYASALPGSFPAYCTKQ